MEKFSMDGFKNISKRSLVRWLLFVGLIYALYDAVYMRADSRHLMLDLADISSGLVPMVVTNIDLPLLVGTVLLCILFSKQDVASALVLRTKSQIMWLAVGVVVFMAIIYMTMPGGMVDAYEIVHTLIVVALLEELVFRGLLFRWMLRAQMGASAYLMSGLAWGALLGIRSMVVGGVGAIGAILPMALVGAVVGTAAAVVYKETNSLWLVIYLHAALSLL